MEILVAVAIIAALVAILLPMVSRAKTSTYTTVCINNMHQIYEACTSYAADNKGKIPDAYTTGNYQYRMAPGNRTPGDPSALPEVYGLAVVLDKHGSLDGNSPIWVCPGQQQWMIDHGNTYAFNIAAQLAKLSMKALAVNHKNPITFDNVNQYPGLSGFRGGFGAGYTVPTAQRKYPHNMAKDGTDATVMLYMNGNAVLLGNN